MRKNFIILCFAIFIFTMFFISFKEDSTTNTTFNEYVISNIRSDSGVNIKTKTLNYTDDYSKEEVNMPNIYGMKDFTKQSNINKEISSYIYGKREEFRNIVKSQKDNGISENKPTFKYEFMSTYKVTNNSNNILSINIIIYSYTGGAHGMTIQKSFNYNINTGEKILLKDMFKKNITYKEIIYKEIEEQIKKNPDNYFSNAIDTVKSMDLNSNFYIVNDGIIIYFNEYDIAPYAAGIVEFKIPFSKISSNNYI